MPLSLPFKSAASRESRNAIGRAVVQLLRDHFNSLPSNRQNFPTTNFWQRAAEATHYDLTPDGVTISVNQIGVLQRLLGGTIKPRHGKFLTIPAIAETYGHKPADFGPLRIIRSSSPTGHVLPALAPVNSGTAYFWLITSATQLPNPDVLPTDEEFTATIRDAVTSFSK